MLRMYARVSHRYTHLTPDMGIIWKPTVWCYIHSPILWAGLLLILSRGRAVCAMGEGDCDHDSQVRMRQQLSTRDY